MNKTDKKPANLRLKTQSLKPLSPLTPAELARVAGGITTIFGDSAKPATITGCGK